MTKKVDKTLTAILSDQRRVKFLISVPDGSKIMSSEVLEKVLIYDKITAREFGG